MTKIWPFYVSTPLIVIGILLSGIPLAAQYTTASLNGNVVDSSGASVPDAKVTVKNTDTGFTQDAVTNRTGGAFLFPRLPVGAYELRVKNLGSACISSRASRWWSTRRLAFRSLFR